MASPADSKVDESEVTSHLQNHQEEEEEQFDLDFPLMRQSSSIYSLTLDEIQNTVCEPGKTFGSMNMDEFLNNIWNVEEAAAAATGVDINAVPAGDDDSAAHQQQTLTSLQRQGSLSLPAPLCRKTVDEVWAEIHRPTNRSQGGGGGPRERKATMGEMTLEDFLIKAGVVREPHVPAPTPPVHESPSPTAAMPPPLQQNFFNPNNGGDLDGRGYPVAPPAVRVGSPGSPVSSDGLGSGHVDNVGGVVTSRKRNAEGGVERRQRRMIKNRESAARSRARKQAYTVELEAELNMLKEENARLRQDERRAKAMRKQMILECMAEYARDNVEKTARSLRRANSAPW